MGPSGNQLHRLVPRFLLQYRSLAEPRGVQAITVTACLAMVVNKPCDAVDPDPVRYSLQKSGLSRRTPRKAERQWSASHQSTAGHADAHFADDNVVQDPHADQPECVAQLAGNGSVCGAGFSDATGVVVRQNGGAGIDAQRGPHDFTGMDAGTVDCAGKELLAVDDAMTVVEPQHVEFFMSQGSQAHSQKVVGVGWVADAALAFKPPFENALGSSEYILLRRFAGEFVTGISQGSNQFHDKLLLSDANA